MKLILLTAEDCDICHEAEEKFKKWFWKEIDSGEMKIVNLDADEAAQELWMENDLPPAPIVILATDKGKIISHIEPQDLIEGLSEVSPAPQEADKLPQVEG